MIMPALALLAASVAGTCEPPARNARTPCASREGWCFDLAIDGRAVVPLDDTPAREQASRAAGQAVCWVLPDPIDPALDAVASANALTPRGPGALYDELEVVMVGLDGQQVPTRKGIRVDPTVRIGGLPMQTAVDVIDSDRLPPGRYVATFRVRGAAGWDRKAVLLRVREP